MLRSGMPGRGWCDTGPSVKSPRDSAGSTFMPDQPATVARSKIAPAGLLFLAITSIGWGFNWPVTKFLLSELPPLTLRGTTGVIGAALLAALALLRGQSLAVDRPMWPRL